MIQRALIMHIDGRIDATDIMLDERFHGFDLQEREAILPEQVLPEVPERLGNELKQQEQQIILDTLEKYSGKRKKVAEVPRN